MKRSVLLLVAFIALCSAAVDPFSYHIYDFYPVNNGLIAIFAGGVRVGAFADLNGMTYIFTEAEMQTPATAAPWLLLKDDAKKREVKDAQGALKAVLISGKGDAFSLRLGEQGAELAAVEKQSFEDTTIVRFQQKQDTIATVVIDGQGTKHGTTLRAQVAINKPTDIDNRVILLVAARNVRVGVWGKREIFSYIKNRKSLAKLSNYNDWTSVINAVRGTLIE